VKPEVNRDHACSDKLESDDLTVEGAADHVAGDPTSSRAAPPSTAPLIRFF
jgi:hypothetical protein